MPVIMALAGISDAFAALPAKDNICATNASAVSSIIDLPKNVFGLLAESTSFSLFETTTPSTRLHICLGSKNTGAKDITWDRSYIFKDVIANATYPTISVAATTYTTEDQVLVIFPLPSGTLEETNLYSVVVTVNGSEDLSWSESATYIDNGCYPRIGAAVSMDGIIYYTIFYNRCSNEYVKRPSMFMDDETKDGNLFSSVATIKSGTISWSEGTRMQPSSKELPKK